MNEPDEHEPKPCPGGTSVPPVPPKVTARGFGDDAPEDDERAQLFEALLEE